MAADAIIHINGWPSSGKLTTAREPAALLDARLPLERDITDLSPDAAASLLAERCRAIFESNPQPAEPIP